MCVTRVLGAYGGAWSGEDLSKIHIADLRRYGSLGCPDPFLDASPNSSQNIWRSQAGPGDTTILEPVPPPGTPHCTVPGIGAVEGGQMHV